MAWQLHLGERETKAHFHTNISTQMPLSNLINVNLKLETTQMSFIRRVNHQILVDPYNEILLSN